MSEANPNEAHLRRYMIDSQFYHLVEYARRLIAIHRVTRHTLIEATLLAYELETRQDIRDRLREMQS